MSLRTLANPIRIRVTLAVLRCIMGYQMVVVTLVVKKGDVKSVMKEMDIALDRLDRIFRLRSAEVAHQEMVSASPGRA
jgi:hypothetical protein